MTTRSLPDARAAYESGNPLASRDAHTKMSIEESGHHTGDSSIGLGLFHGSLEGLSTSTLLLIVSYTSGVPPQAAWRLCSCACAGLAALAGLRSWLRHGAHARMYWREHARESWELQHYPEGESREMVELWEAWGVPHAAAETAIAALLPSRAFFVDLMMAQELKMQPVEWGGKAAVPAGLWHARRQPLSHTRHTRTHTRTRPPHSHQPDAPAWRAAAATALGFAALSAPPLFAAHLMHSTTSVLGASAAALTWGGVQLAIPLLTLALCLLLLEAVHAWALPAQYVSKERGTTRLIYLALLCFAAVAGLALGRAR